MFLKGKEWVLDAEPNVTTLFERLFQATRTEKIYTWQDESDNFKYTSRPRFIQNMPKFRKDIEWFIQRFNLEISKEDLKRIKKGAAEYDRSQEQARKSYIQPKPINDLALPLRKYQEQACSLALHRGSLLVADQVGLGKTPIGIAIGGRHPPALCVVPPHLISQWEFEIKKFLPEAKTYKITKGKQDNIPSADFYIVSYFLVGKCDDWFTKKIPIKTLILDEVHSLRHNSTQKYSAVSGVAEKANYRVGLSATPIMNYGSDMYNIFSILEPGALGKAATFYREWCNWGQIKDPELFGNFLRKNLMMVRRTRSEVGRDLETVNRIAYNVDADMATLKKLEDEAKALALKVITGDFHESGEAARQLDWKLRHATGVAKAKSVAEIVKAILESGEKVVLFGWHRDVYDIWLKELWKFNPVMYTGSESRKQKEESLKEFIEGEAQVFIMSLRSGAGVNGLQTVSSYAIFGELDWSPGCIDQCIGRIWREGQGNQVTAVFITINDGADPFMKKIIGKKATEAKQIINPEADVIANTGDSERILNLAKDYLRRQGEDVNAILNKKTSEDRGDLIIPPPKLGEDVHELWRTLSSAAFNPNSEDVMQSQVEKVLKDKNILYEREVYLSKRSRVDFKVNDILVECKVAGFNKRSLLRQIKRYIVDCPNAKAVVALTPEQMNNFTIRDVPIYTINVSDNSLLIGGLS